MKLKYSPAGCILDMTVLCNQSCHFCWRANVDDVKRETQAAPHMVMPTDLYMKVIDSVSQVETIKTLSLSGPMGEPMLVSDLAFRAAYARKKNRFSKITVNTNGFALDKHDARALLRGFTEISVSLDSVDPDLHAEIHGKKGQIRKILMNLDHLMREKEWLRRHGVRVAKVKVRFTEHDANKAHWPEFKRVMNRRCDGIIRKRIHSFMDRFEGMENEAAAILCNQPFKIINVDFRGTLSTCCVNWRPEPRFGLVDSPAALKDAWEGMTYEGWRDSRHEGICKGCSGLGSAAQRPGGGLHPIDRQRLHAIKLRGEKRYYGG